MLLQAVALRVGAPALLADKLPNVLVHGLSVPLQVGYQAKALSTLVAGVLLDLGVDQLVPGEDPGCFESGPAFFAGVNPDPGVDGF